VRLLIGALIMGLGMGSAQAEQLQCRLNGQASIITLNLQPPKVIHQVAGQAALSVVGKANNQGVLSYTLPDMSYYQLDYNQFTYTQTIKGKPPIQGRCAVVVATPSKPVPPPARALVPVVPPPVPVPHAVKPALPKPAKSTFTCGTKRYCKQMQSCEEATYYMNHCGLSKLDSDHDGSPCENVCGD
jgi:hypothetical protein